jgi:hypothetical protein
VHLTDASPSERLQLALCNLAMASQRTLPLSTSHLLFGSRLWERSGYECNQVREPMIRYG